MAVPVTGVTDEYDPQLNRDRFGELCRVDGDVTFHQLDVADHEALDRAVAERTADRIVHPGARAGVRRSDIEPLRQAIGTEPATSIADGVPRFVEW